MVKAAMKTAKASKPGKGKIHCPNCSAVIAAGYRLCPECGKPTRQVLNGHVVNGLVPMAATPAAPRPLSDTFKPEDAVGRVQAAIAFALHCGGIAEASRILEAVRLGVEQLA